MAAPPAAVTARLSLGLLRAHAAATFVFLYAPIVVLVALSFNAGPHATIWQGFSVDWYRKLAADQSMKDAAANSLTVGALATLGSTVVGTLAAVGLDRFRFRGRGLTGTLLFLPVVVPEIVMAVSLMTLFRSVGVEEMNLTTVALSHLAFTVSYVTVVVKARLAGLDRSVEEAARDLGAGPVGAFARATLPRLWPGIVAGALLAFTLSLDDYVVTSLVSGVGSQTLPVRVYSLLRTSMTPVPYAACTVMLAVTVTLAATSQWALSRK
ncbi:MAG TPA: ABC transporter permease [Humisphaera sp.]